MEVRIEWKNNALLIKRTDGEGFGFIIPTDERTRADAYSAAATLTQIARWLKRDAENTSHDSSK